MIQLWRHDGRRRYPSSGGGTRWLPYTSSVHELRDSAVTPSLHYPLASSSHKWICQLMSQGPEQQMISSNKAKDKENKSLDFCWEKLKKRKRHFLSSKQCRVGVREQTLSSPFLLRSAFLIVWPCWPLYPTKARTEIYWPNCTQAKWLFSPAQNRPYLCRSWEFLT